MTKKRFKLSMAALGLLAAFFMVLIAVLLAPTLASANKDAGNPHHHGGAPDTVVLHGGPGGASGGESGGSIFTENEPGHDHGQGFETPFCVHGIYPCADAGDAGDDFDHAGNHPDGFAYGDGSNPQGGGDGSKGYGGYASNFWGGAGGGAGGAGGGAGGAGGGAGGDGKDGDKGQDGDKTNPDDSVPDFQIVDVPGDEVPFDFVGPFVDDPKDDPTDDPKSDDGPTGDHPPITSLAPIEVPEPLTLSLFAVGLAGAAQLRRRSKRQS